LTDRLDDKTLRVGPRLPFQHRRGMIVLKRDDAGAAGDRQDLRRRRHAVTDRGYQRDIGGIGIDQPSRGSPRALVLLVCEAGVQCPGSCFAPNRGAAGFLSSQRQRTVGGRIQVANTARHLEQVALRGKHVGLFVAIWS
jgi:hypothetical protein